MFTRVKVHRDYHVEIAKALYSVPEHLLGAHLDARADSELVTLYTTGGPGAGRLVKTHPRQPPGGRSTDRDDLPEHKAGYALRDLSRLITACAGHGQHIGIYAERLLDEPLPWTRMRAVYRLLGLVRRYGARPGGGRLRTVPGPGRRVRVQDRLDARESPRTRTADPARRRRLHPPQHSRRPIRPHPKRIRPDQQHGTRRRPAQPHPRRHEPVRRHHHTGGALMTTTTLTSTVAEPNLPAGPRDPVGTDLISTLKTLKLGGLAHTLPERLTLARQHKMGHAAFLQLVLADEITRRESRSAMLRARAAGLDPTMRLDTWDELDDLTYDRTLLSDPDLSAG